MQVGSHKLAHGLAAAVAAVHGKSPKSSLKSPFLEGENKNSGLFLIMEAQDEGKRRKETKEVRDNHTVTLCLIDHSLRATYARRNSNVVDLHWYEAQHG